MNESKQKQPIYEAGLSRLHELGPQAKNALLVGTYATGKVREETAEHLNELERLTDTYGLETVEKISCPLRKIESATYLGKGKVQEIAQLARDQGAHIVIFDDVISPQQQRNLELLMEMPVIDRTELILGVFGQHAHTKEARLQVDLAQLRYQLPRLKRLWTHLSRQRISGGTGAYLKGTGESQIETDRRLLRKKIDRLQKELDEVKKHRENQRKARERSGIPTFAIVGYTNAGKSTLLNALTDAEVLVEDKLFATLDTTTRKFILPNRQEVLLVDTVGFIRKIPHMLVAAFKSTLEEAVKTDILLHLLDVSNPHVEEHCEATLEILKELKAENRPMITIFNKIDRCTDRFILQKLCLQFPKTVEISATERTGFDHLMQAMIHEISRLRKRVYLRVPQSHYGLVSEIMREGKVLSCDYEGNDILLDVEIPTTVEHKVYEFIQP